MKVSEFIRQYHISGEIIGYSDSDTPTAFWAGWLIGQARDSLKIKTGMAPWDQAREMAIRAAEFIEEHATQ